MVKKTYTPRLQDRILLILYQSGGELSIEQICKLSKLTSIQVYEAVSHLKNRAFIKQRLECRGAERKVPPIKSSLIKLRNVSGTQNYLSKRKLI